MLENGQTYFKNLLVWTFLEPEGYLPVKDSLILKTLKEKKNRQIKLTYKK